jgi:asparagine synthase (glutamine-hydrolysing)
MCGIAGILRFRGLNVEDKHAIGRMTDTMSHRGPDDSGVYIGPAHSPVVALGHSRLSIIDLSSGGHQPMADPSRRYWIVFNGEIYNYRELKELLRNRGWKFRSTCDTEVLLYLYIVYGATALCMIEGMFAFAVWDEKERTIFAARDRAGKKPFFYHFDGGKFLFASEIKAILTHPEVGIEENVDRFHDYFNLRYVPCPETLFKGILKLPPASCATVSQNGMSVRRYWDIPPALPRRRGGARDAQKEFLDRFTSAVEKRLIADVPVGAFLSGGIDSSAVVSAMHRIAGENIKTYSVGFETPWKSELEYAKVVAKAFRTDHHEVLVTQSDYRDTLEDLIWNREMPVSEPADIPIYRMSRLAREKVKVVLSGEGSDEVLGGYYKYVLDPYTGYFRALPSPVKALARTASGALPFRFKKILHYLKVADIEDDVRRSFAWFSTLDEDVILSEEFKQNSFFPPSDVKERLDFLGYLSPEAMFRLDLGYWLPDNLLERADRITMANSLELRAPFLDHHLIEFCFSLPMNFKVKGFSTKRLLKEAMRKHLPGEIVRRTKVGFTTPLSDWLRRELRGWAEDIAFSDRCRQRGLFDHKALRRLFDEHVSGARDNSRAIWTVINFEMWFQIFFSGNMERMANES